MLQITISGTLLENAETCVDKNGRTYTRFSVSCGSEDLNGRTQFLHFSCTCYVKGYEYLKKGDQVFLTGKFSAKLNTGNDGKTYMNLYIMVYQAAGGYKANERKKPNE